MDTKKLRQKILDLAIRGKLVPQDPNDEPASVLLERIRAEKERLIKEGKIKRSKETAEDDKIEAPFEIPESWEWTTIDEICFLIFAGGDKPEVLSKSPTEKCCFPVFANAVQNDGLYGYTNIPAVTNKAITISARGTIGFVCKRMSPFTPIVRLITVIPPESIIDYLTYTLCCLTKPTEGSSIPQLTVPTFKKNKIPLPPLAEQERIVDEIERWFAVIDELESNEDDLLKAIDKAKSKILDLAIHGKLVPQDPNDEPAIELLKRINPKFEPCDNKLDSTQLPESWCWTTLGEVCTLITGSTPSKIHPEYYGGDFPFYKPSDLDAGRHVTTSYEYLTKEGRSISRIIPIGSTAICCIGSIGKCGYIEREGTTNQQINTAIPLKCLYSLYLYYYCNSKSFVDNLSADSSAITISIVNKSKLGKMPIAIPPLSEQLRIVAKIEEVFKALDALS